MPKNMARLDKNNVVINIEWYSDAFKESDILKEIYDYPVIVNDTYENGKFYRNGELVLNKLEKAYQKNNEYAEALLELGVEL